MQNREIKFKAWDVAQKRWCNFLYVDIVDWEVSWNGKMSYIFQEFIGLKDKHGNEIYEGDTVEYTLDGNRFHGEVIWEHFGWVLKDLQIDSSFPLTTGLEYKIIGNILENPELCAK